MYWLKDILYELKKLFMWWVTIAPWESALRVRWGKHVTTLEPGVHLRIPYADRVYRQSVRLRVCNLPPQTLTTLDGHTVTLQGMLGYEIFDIETLYETLHHAEDTITNIACSSLAQYIGTHTREDCTPGNIETAANELIDLEQYGVGGTHITITTFAFVKTYRLITGSGELYTSGDSLSTSENGEE